MANQVPHLPMPAQARRLFHIGNICAQWSHIEYQLAHAIWKMLNLNAETGKIVTGGLDMLPRLNMAINLAHHLKAPKSLIDKLKHVRSTIQDSLGEKRNRAVHGVQFMSDPSDMDSELLVEVHRGKGGRDRKPLSEDDLNQLGEEIHALGCDLDSVLGPFLRANTIASKIRATVSRTVRGPNSG